MSFFDTVEMFEGALSSGVKNILIPVGEKILEGACELRRKYPNRYTNGGILAPVMDSLCEENGHLPQPPMISV